MEAGNKPLQSIESDAMDYDFDPFMGGPGNDAEIRIFEDGGDRAATMRWGFEPIEPGGRPVSLIHSEKWMLERPCLAMANEFGLKQERTVKYPAKLVTDKKFFLLSRHVAVGDAVLASLVRGVHRASVSRLRAARCRAEVGGVV